MTKAPVTLPPRDPAGHKGTFGVVSVVGGCAHGGVRMIGGPCLSAIACLRAGAGLVRLVMPAPILSAGLTIAPSATGVELEIDHEHEIIGNAAAVTIRTIARQSDCLAIGPGLGVGAGPAEAALAAAQADTPVVIDADALNNLAEFEDLQTRFTAANAIVTPHPGEFRRLAASLGLNPNPMSESERYEAAGALADALACVVVLKGSGTVVSDGARTWVNDRGANALATAGTGDVLTGVIAGLIAQFSSDKMLLDLYDSARAAVWAHAVASELWMEDVNAQAGMHAMELADRIPQTLETLRGRS